nr:FixH family protein [Mesorhizobium sp.]
MRSIGPYALAMLLALAFGAYLLAPPVAQKPELDMSRERTTANGLYVAAIAPEAPEIKQGELQSWTITVKTAAGQPVSDAVIQVDGGMPEHNHGLPTAPEVTRNLGEGHYRIEGIKFSMAGRWELRFDITSPAGTDTATFNLVL